METGTLKELNVKPGDVVKWVDDGTIHEIVSACVIPNGESFFGEVYAELSNYGWGVFCEERFRIISRAADPKAPKLWCDMTPEEKGALLLAAHEGKVIEVWDSGQWVRRSFGVWADGNAYRVRPEPKRGTVTMQWAYEKGGIEGYAHPFNKSATHRITLIRMDEL